MKSEMNVYERDIIAHEKYSTSLDNGKCQVQPHKDWSIQIQTTKTRDSCTVGEIHNK